MNCFSHSVRFLEDPYFAAGTCLPDWLSACDRRCRVRADAARQWAENSDPELASLARGVVQHHHDDDWFHRSRIFVETSARYSIEIRELLGQDAGFRPGLLGHIVIELFLDAWLDRQHPGELDRFYTIVADLDPVRIESLTNQFSSRPTARLGWFIERFRAAQYIYDYRDDQRMLYRLNQVLGRVGLDPVGRELDDWMSGARLEVESRATEFLAGFSAVPVNPGSGKGKPAPSRGQDSLRRPDSLN